MASTVITIGVDSDIAELVIQDLKTAPRKFRRLYRQRITKLAEDTIRELARPAPPVKRPIQWKTQKQRRAFFATDGFGKGIPTRRTNSLNRGWKSEELSDFREGFFTIYNDATTRDYFTGELVFYEQFVQGEFQQPFHRNTGWVLSQDTLADSLVKAEDIIIDTWFEVHR
jgi:hypothetical protein